MCRPFRKQKFVAGVLVCEAPLGIVCFLCGLPATFSSRSLIDRTPLTLPRNTDRPPQRHRLAKEERAEAENSGGSSNGSGRGSDKRRWHGSRRGHRTHMYAAGGRGGCGRCGTRADNRYRPMIEGTRCLGGRELPRGSGESGNEGQGGLPKGEPAVSSIQRGQVEQRFMRHAVWARDHTTERLKWRVCPQLKKTMAEGRRSVRHGVVGLF